MTIQYMGKKEMNVLGGLAVIHDTWSNGWTGEEQADKEWDSTEGLNTVSESEAIDIPLSQESCSTNTGCSRPIHTIKSFCEANRFGFICVSSQMFNIFSHSCIYIYRIIDQFNYLFFRLF